MQLCVLIMNLLISNLNLTNPMLHQLNLIFFVIILKMVCLNLANASGVLVTPRKAWASGVAILVLPN
jgi:hypothetical protein